MKHCAGLDVSLNSTAVCVLDLDGRCCAIQAEA